MHSPHSIDGSRPRRGVLLLCLGSPDNADIRSVRRFLREFLGDRRVIPLPWLVRKFLLECIILPRHASVATERYRSIWTPEGSPFTVNTERLRKRVQGILGESLLVLAAARYGNPTVCDALQKFVQAGTTDIVVIPQFPQYAESSTETAVEHFKSELARIAPNISAEIMPPFYDDPRYISALAQSIKLPAGAKLVFSFHGIPVKSIRGDAKCDLSSSNFTPELCTKCGVYKNCYRRQCYATTEATAIELKLQSEQYEVAFQSRFGKGKWLAPTTADTLKKLAGTPNLYVVSPGFTADCIETLYELNLPGVERISCLNDFPAFAEFIVDAAKSAFARSSKSF